MAEVFLYRPGGNATALVTGEVAPDEMAQLARRVLSEHREVEQVGFVSLGPDSVRLAMAGGEFCLNAARCAGLMASQRGIAPCDVLVSGFTEPVRVSVSGPDVSVSVPASFLKASGSFRGYPTVHFQGISFAVVSRSLDAFEREWLVRELGAGLPASGAVEVTEAGPGEIGITPWVLVSAVGSYLPETACGSGSLAAVLSSGLPETSVVQPSGERYRVRVLRGAGGALAGFELSGPVEFLGTAGPVDPERRA